MITDNLEEETEMVIEKLRIERRIVEEVVQNQSSKNVPLSIDESVRVGN